MALNQDETYKVYQDLYEIFPEDLHIARPLIQILQAREDTEHARNMALDMARRMLARGRPGNAIGFLEICKQLHHPDKEQIEAMYSMAQITADGPIDMETGSNKVFLLINQLSDQEALDFLKQGRLIRVSADQDIVRQGEISRNFYLILEGHMSVHMEAGNGRHISLSTLEPGHFFGEFACVYQLPRTATVTAKQDSLILEFSDISISQLMQRSPLAGDRLMRTVQGRLVHSMSFGHPAFTDLHEADRKWLAEESRVVEYDDGSEIINGQEPHDSCCVIIHGNAVVKWYENESRHERILEHGDMFGDISPMIQLPENATVITDDHCLVCNIPRNIFKAFMAAYASFDNWMRQYGRERKKWTHRHPQHPATPEE